LKVKVKRLYESAKLPTYATDGSGCFDIYTMLNGDTDYNAPHTYSTGLAFEIPEDHVMLIFSRSGHGFKNDVRLSNCVGVIDSDYRGECRAILVNHSTDWIKIQPLDRICQFVVAEVPLVETTLVEQTSETERGTGGFGSTGKQ